LVELNQSENIKNDTSAHFQQISKDLIELSEKVKNTIISENKHFSFKFLELNTDFSDALRKEIRVWEKQYPKSLYIYIYRATSDSDLRKINSEYELTREKNIGKRAFARINKDNRESNVLYVGSSRSIGQRTKDHLGFSSKSVFALQIYHWSRELDGYVELDILRFEPITDYDVIQSIEDGLWDIHKPMFGRQGKK